MAGHLASDFAFSLPPGGGDGLAGLELGCVDPRTWLSFQGLPGGPGIGPDSEVLGISPCPLVYEFRGRMVYCGPQVGLGLVPQAGMETLQPEDQAGARVENNSEGASSGPCAAHPSAVKLEKVEPSPEESQDMKALQKELEQSAKLLKQKRITLGYTQADVGLTLGISLERCSGRQPSAALQLSLKNMCKLQPLLEKWVEEADSNENLQEICKSETLVQAQKRKRTSIENRVKWNLENVFLKCPKLSLQQFTTIAKQLGLEKDVVECGSVTGARRANDQALSIPNEKSMRLWGRLSQGGLYPILCPQAPTLVPQAM